LKNNKYLLPLLLKQKGRKDFVGKVGREKREMIEKWWWTFKINQRNLSHTDISYL